MFHMVTVFPLSWVFLFTNESPARFLVIESVAAAFGVLAIIASGYLADRVGRRPVLGASASAIAVFSGSAPPLLDMGGLGEATYLIVGCVWPGSSFGRPVGVGLCTPRQRGVGRRCICAG